MNDATTHRSAMVAPVAGLILLTCLWLALAPSALASGEFEPNDTRETAHGPLAGGGDYTATFETDNDVDWYLFYVRSYSQMDISSSWTRSSRSWCRWYTELELLDKDGKEITDFSPGSVGTINHLQITLDAGRYFLRAANPGRSCNGDSYRFRIDPAPAITTTPDLSAPPLVVPGKRIDVKRRRAEITMRCPASAASLACSGKLKLRTRKKVRFSGKRRKAVIGRSVFHVAAGETGVVTVKVGKNRAKLLRRKRRARKAWLIVHMRDGSGNYAQRRAKLKLRP